MPTYLVSNRPPTDYRPSPEVAAAWNEWFDWANPEDGTAVAGADVPSAGLVRDPSRVSFDLQPYRDIVRLTVTHDHVASDAEWAALAVGWAAVLSNLKSYLETGHALPTPPWDVLRGFVRS